MSNDRIYSLVVFISTLLGVLMWGWSCDYQKETSTPSGIKIVLKPEDRPRFERKYAIQLKSRNLAMIVTIRYHYFDESLDYSGELDQPTVMSNKWVLFDPENPADKILDREIIGEVEARCREIIALDKQWRSDKPKQFTDERGQVWERKP